MMAEKNSTFTPQRCPKITPQRNWRFWLKNGDFERKTAFSTPKQEQCAFARVAQLDRAVAF